MDSKNVVSCLALCMFAVPGLTSSSSAAVATGTLLVSATVIDTCLVAATPLAFGALSSATFNTELAPSIVSIVCTAAKPAVTVTLDGGASAANGVRQMSDGSTARVPYQVYADPGRSNPVGIGGQIFSGSVAAIVPTTFNIYGTVDAATYAAGIYSDAATITLNY